MANVAIQGYIRDEGGSVIAGANYQMLFYRNIAGSSATMWKSTVKQTDVTGLYSANLGDNDWIGVPGVAQSGDMVIVAVWNDPVPNPVRAAVHNQYAYRIITLNNTSNDTYVFDVTCYNTRPPITSFAVPTTIRRLTDFTLSNNSSDSYNFANNHRQTRYYIAEDIFPYNGIERTVWSLNGVPQADIIGTASPTLNLAYGPYTAVLIAYDYNTGQGNTQTINFNVTYRPPVPGLGWNPLNPTISQLVTFTPSITDIDGRVGTSGTGVSYYTDGAIRQTRIPRTQTWTYQYGTHAAQSIRQDVYWHNGFAEELVQQTFSLTMTNIPPTGSLSKTQQNVNTALVEWTVTASDPDGTVVRYDWYLHRQNGAVWDLIDTALNFGNIRGYVGQFSQSGTYRATVVLTDDDGGQTSLTDSVSVVVTPIGIGGDEMGPGGTIVYLRTQTSGGVPISHSAAWITTDVLGTNVIAGTLFTDANGIAGFLLDNGAYFAWFQNPGWNFNNGNPIAGLPFTVSGTQTFTFTGTAASVGAITVEDICSAALVSIGDNKILSIDDTSVRAVVCKQKYQYVLDALFREYFWNFAIVRTVLSPDVDNLGTTITPAFGYLYQYSIPADFVRLMRVDGGATELVMESQKFLSDQPSLNVQYIARVAQPALWDVLFREAFIARLAYEISIPLAGSQELAKNLYSIYKDKVRMARLADGQEGTPVALSSTTLTREVRG